MATFDTTRTAYGTATVASRVFATLNAVTASIVSWNDARVTRKALTGLTDRELADIGLHRSDIDYIADSHIIR